MTTSSKISKRDVMNRAWNIYRRGSYSKNFGECLSRAWWVEKETIIYNAKQAAIEAEKERLAKWHASDEYKALQAQPRKVDASLIASMERTYSAWAYSGD